MAGHLVATWTASAAADGLELVVVILLRLPALKPSLLLGEIGVLVR